jgi:hypothetical protein
MRPALLRIGRDQTPVVTIDAFCGDCAPVIALAEELAPFPPAANHYPGLRRVIGAHEPAMAYAERLLEAAAPFIAGAYDIDSFDLIEASFSLVTAPAQTLTPVQRSPHFDSTDPRHFAVMHYLRETAGTAFYRHRATGIECVTEANLARYLTAARAEVWRTDPAYIAGSNKLYELIGGVTGHADRLVIYPGNLLHSGVIARETQLSTDPRKGRLTANLFIRAT